MLAISLNSSTGTVEAAAVDTVGTFISNGSKNYAESNPTETATDTNTSESVAMSTPVLVGVIATAVIAFVAIVALVIRSRRCKNRAKLLSPSIRGMTSTTTSENSSNTLGASAESTMVASPQPPLLQTFKLSSRLSAKELPDDQIAIDIQDASMNGLPSARSTQNSQDTSFVSHRSVFSSSFLMLANLRSSLPTVFRSSRVSRSSETNSSSMDTAASMTSYAQTVTPSELSSAGPIPFDQKQDEWRDLSETCWSIDPGSDGETESERFMMPTASRPDVYTEVRVLNCGRLSTLSDRTVEFENETAEKSKDVDSFDDSSRRRDLIMSALDDLSPRRERGISQFDDSSPRRIRGPCTPDSRQKANSVAETDTNKFNWSYFSADSNNIYYDETNQDSSSIFFYDSDSDCSSRNSSDSDESLLEEEF
ncbi:hypothetical protein GN244_ATG11724 [Phytophthora infestans]|uniref:Uncharacterized protein n=1 Tax=Phytophthora infestans TaxID=4787 RepID=A0A833WBK8_PHYIN|nr:hypothetical protein GN244_ATG11724 [Phytophthora infestans]KAF4143122.1 hypothetical protein GN958_ATG07701 [Phytophthora infestans]